MSATVGRQLQALVCGNADLAVGLVAVRGAVLAARVSGVSSARIDRGLGLKQDGGLLRGLVYADGPLRGDVSLYQPDDRTVLAAEVDTAALALRGLLIDDAFKKIRTILAARAAGGKLRSEEAANVIERLTDDVEYAINLNLPEGAYLSARDDVAEIWEDLVRLRRQSMHLGFPLLARYFAVVGASQREIATALGSVSAEYGHRPTLSAWRRFTAPWIAVWGRSSAVGDLLSASRGLSDLDANVTRIVGAYLGDRYPVWTESVPTGSRTYGRRHGRAFIFIP